MDVRIGVTYSPKELDLDLGDDVDRDALKKSIEAALSDDDGVLWLSDKRGREVAIPSGKVAYVELGSPEDERRIGFGAG
ncbi:MAG: DUF3107 domain-containing protein [Acidimicrobiales bacterium]|nr:DUF3107 domain-containing protein [Acidimicrobiales bacterium]